MTDEELAEEYYYKTYPVTLNIGEEERKDTGRIKTGQAEHILNGISVAGMCTTISPRLSI